MTAPGPASLREWLKKLNPIPDYGWQVGLDHADAWQLQLDAWEQERNASDTLATENSALRERIEELQQDIEELAGGGY